jgi:hexokinase
MQFLTATETIKRNFFQELRDASDGKTTSLRFIKHELPSEKLISDGEIFQVLVVGGTVFRKALLKKDREQFVILDDYSEEHPSLTSKEMLLEYLAKHLSPNVSKIAVNFAFPLKPFLRDGRADGELLSATKAANTLNGLIGEPVGEAIEMHILKRLDKEITVSVLNDAICLLLSGTESYSINSIAGAIMGTGTNATFFHNEKAINVQSGGFDKFSLSDECKEIDKDSLMPGASLFEKETAGGYLYKHFNYYLDKNHIDFPRLDSTLQLNYLINDHPEFNSGSNEELKKMPDQVRHDITETTRSLFEKSAAYFAGQIAGLTAFKNHDMTFIIEGSMYWENDLYRKFVDGYLEKLSPDLKIKTIKVVNSPISGAARLIA